MPSKSSGPALPPAGEAPPLDTAAPPSFDLAALKGLLVDVVAEQLAPLHQTIADLQARVDDQAALVPRMEPIRRLDEEDLDADEFDSEAEDPSIFGRQEWSGDPKGESQAIKASIPRTVNGYTIPKPMLLNFQPRFRAQQKIQLNPELVPPGGKLTWGEICAKVGSKGTGVILKRFDQMTVRGFWRYHVYVQGVSQKMGFSIDEDQLLPARRSARRAVA